MLSVPLDLTREFSPLGTGIAEDHGLGAFALPPICKPASQRRLPFDKTQQRHHALASPRALIRLTQHILAQSRTQTKLPEIRFMQPEFSASSTPVTSQTAPRESPPTQDQHGLSHQDLGGVALPSEPDVSGTGAGTPVAAADEQLALDAAFAASLQETERDGGSERRRLSPSGSGSTSSPPPATPSAAVRNRIEEYEKASTPPVGRKREGPAFEVIKKQRAPEDKRSPIAELPNGMRYTIHITNAQWTY